MLRFPVADWLAEQIRLTLFSNSGENVGSHGWWQLLTNSDPDDIQQNLKQGTTTVKGQFGVGNLILRSEPTRIDLLYSPPETTETTLGYMEFSVVGPLIDALPTFARIAEKLLSRDDLPPINRMAFGTVVLHPEPNQNAAYQRIPDYIPVRLPEGVSDFLFQLNLPPKPSASGVENLKLNRLSKWHVVRGQQLTLTGAGPAVQHAELIAFRAELDINTMPTFEGAIPHAQLCNVFRELISEGESIAENGVVAQ